VFCCFKLACDVAVFEAYEGKLGESLLDILAAIHQYLIGDEGFGSSDTLLTVVREHQLRGVTDLEKKEKTNTTFNTNTSVNTVPSSVF
jgi:hypothetical protein